MNLDDFLENDERREVQLLQLLLKAGAVGCLLTNENSWLLVHNRHHNAGGVRKHNGNNRRRTSAAD